MSKGSTSKTLVWILMALLIFGLGGFGITNLSGNVQSLGKVGDKEIDINAYARALQQELRAVETQVGRTVSFAEARAAGLERQVLGGLVTARGMDAETARLGLSIGDENLRRALLEIPAFQNADGSFNREAYRYALDQTRMSEADFEESIREDSVRSLLQAALVSGVAIPEIYVDTLLGYVGEERGIVMARLTEEDLAYPVAAPQDADLRAFYDANIARFTRPAMRRITYAWLSPDMLIDKVEVDEAALRALYEERGDEFNRPERRLVERLAFADMASAQEAMDRLTAEEITFETLVLDRGLALDDVDLGDVSAADLGAAGETVFSAVVGAMAGPAESDLGPAIFRINGVLPAMTTAFEDALPELREELAAERARRVIDGQIGDVDDLLAAGATLEELARETEMQLGQIDWHEGISDGIAGYEGFRALAAIVTAEDFPEVDTLDDGGIFALRLDEEIAAAPAPFAEVEAEVAEAWRKAETLSRLQALADGLLPQLGGDVDFAAFGLTAESRDGLIRGGFLADAPEGALEKIFELDPGAVATVADDESLVILRVTSVAAPDLANPEIAGLRKALLQQGAQDLSQDLFNAYAQDIQFLHGVTIDQQALNAVHAQFQ
ncbi:SurA N-terminal domain-containing protein [Shimia sp.]|uniref:peptidylprolyl isomerase n=1 Tax=Shimia sp. TaxID=1954381 RepID=UPI0035641C5A